MVSPTSAIPTFFDDDDCAFLARMFAVYPHLESNFEHFLAMDPAHRQSEALEALNFVPRTGWKNLGIPNPESVYDHTMHLCKRARETAPAAKLNAEHLVAVAMVHDLPEAIVGDFAPTDEISNDDKHRLEHLAARVIFTNDLKSLAHYCEYEGKQTKAALLLSDLDKFDACEQALIYEAHHPTLTVGAFDRFVASSRPKLKTDIVKTMLDDLEKNADTIREQALMNHRGPIADRIAKTYGAQYASERGR
jgi:putative hydrolases of HD superfamily